jgi:hypothetical protein
MAPCVQLKDFIARVLAGANNGATDVDVGDGDAVTMWLIATDGQIRWPVAIDLIGAIANRTGHDSVAVRLRDSPGRLHGRYSQRGSRSRDGSVMRWRQTRNANCAHNGA